MCDSVVTDHSCDIGHFDMPVYPGSSSCIPSSLADLLIPFYMDCVLVLLLYFVIFI